MRSIVALSVLLVLGAAVQADTYNYDFSTMGFSDGQNLEGMTLDAATFTSETGDLRYYSDYGAGIGTGYTWGAAADTYIAFSSPVSGLSFRAGDGGGDYDAFAVTAYEFGTHNLLGTWSSAVFDGGYEPIWYTLDVPAANVGWLAFDPGNGGTLPGVKESLGGVVITDMGYSVVPLPGAVLLGALGLSVAGWRLKRKTA
jgi:hypothetical protein